MWALFVVVVVPPGAILTMLLLSGNRLAMQFGKKVLSTPVTLFGVQLSLAMLMTGLCGSLAALSYSHYRRKEIEFAESNMKAMVYEMHKMNAFRTARNLWLSLLGFSLWAIAWRLKGLHSYEILVPHKPKVRKGAARIANRLIWGVVALVCFAVADVPLCRLNYQLQLYSFVSPEKERLLVLEEHDQCTEAKLGAAQGACAEFCEKAQQLSVERGKAIQWARDWHILGRLAAEMFDDARGVQQGQSRIDDLFAKKTCAQVIRSSDKSNLLVNLSCVAITAIAIMGLFVATANIIGDPAGSVDEPSTAGPVKGMAVDPSVKKDDPKQD
mmetsp:Transcript_11829/g.22080  ORF Transcript_11829/g.22080 Transcript_11829/m.22080 type:complete len:327 (+) Transcript_11829:67-1047(+)